MLSFLLHNQSFFWNMFFLLNFIFWLSCWINSELMSICDITNSSLFYNSHFLKQLYNFLCFTFPLSVVIQSEMSSFVFNRDSNFSCHTFTNAINCTWQILCHNFVTLHFFSDKNVLNFIQTKPIVTNKFQKEARK